MPGLNPNLVAHALNVEPGVKPVIQPMRTFHPDIEAQIIKEVQKLLAVGFIRPIEHLKRLSNIVSVKKNNWQIRFCVNFRNLNKTCIKDEFPLPNMDMLIDLAVGHAMFSLWMDLVATTKLGCCLRKQPRLPFEPPLEIFTTLLCLLASRMLVPLIKGP